MANKTFRVDDFLRAHLNVSLPSCKQNAEGGHTMDNDDWQMVVQVRMLRELEKLNRLLACPNFIGIPQTLREIKREIKRATNRIPIIAKPRKPRAKK